MKLSLIVFLLNIILNSGTYQKIKNYNTLSAKLVNIEYYSKCKCNEKSPVLTRLLIKVTERDLKNLNIRIKYSNGITMKFPVSKKDKAGNIVYDFCTSINTEKKFSVFVVNSKGDESNEIKINAVATETNTFNTTPPSTIKVQ